MPLLGDGAAILQSLPPAEADRAKLGHLGGKLAAYQLGAFQRAQVWCPALEPPRHPAPVCEAAGAGCVTGISLEGGYSRTHAYSPGDPPPLPAATPRCPVQAVLCICATASLQTQSPSRNWIPFKRGSNALQRWLPGRSIALEDHLPLLRKLKDATP